MRAYDLMLDVQENNKCIMYKYDPNTHMFSSVITEADRFSLLAKAIPALSESAGRTDLSTITDIQRQVNMNAWGRSSTWGRDHAEYGDRWLHGDLKDMAYFYIKPIFDNVVTQGELK